MSNKRGETGRFLEIKNICIPSNGIFTNAARQLQEEKKSERDDSWGKETIYREALKSQKCHPCFVDIAYLTLVVNHYLLVRLIRSYKTRVKWSWHGPLVCL